MKRHIAARRDRNAFWRFIAWLFRVKPSDEAGDGVFS